MLDIEISVCQIHVRLRKPVRSLKVYWPILHLSHWVQYFLNNKPEILLGGQRPDPQGKWKDMYYNFWSAYRVANPNHPLFEEDFDQGACLPYFFHGDEGRGQLKRPYMVISWQLAIGHHGPDVCNDTSYPGCSCFSSMQSYVYIAQKKLYICVCFFSSSRTGTLLQADSFSAASPAIYTTKTGHWMICWGSWRNKPLTHFMLGSLPLGLSFKQILCLINLWATKNVLPCISPVPSLTEPSHRLRTLAGAGCASSTSGRKAIGLSWERFLLIRFESLWIFSLALLI